LLDGFLARVVDCVDKAKVQALSSANGATVEKPKVNAGTVFKNPRLEVHANAVH
jgi:hypothetical protein